MQTIITQPADLISQSHSQTPAQQWELNTIPRGKMELLQINKIPVSPRVTALTSPTELKTPPWLFIRGISLGFACSFLGFGREDKHVVTNSKTCMEMEG